MGRYGTTGHDRGPESRNLAAMGKGASLSEIGRAVGKFPASIFGLLRLHGGVTPPTRHRAIRVLTLAEREEISRGLAAEVLCVRLPGSSIVRLRPSAVRSRETPISRVIVRTGRMRLPGTRARRPKLCRLALNGQAQENSGQQAGVGLVSGNRSAGWLKRTYLDDESLQVSHETIYRSIFVQTRGVLKKELQKHLRTQRVFRQSRHSNIRGLRRGQIIDGVPIAKSIPGGRGPSRSGALGRRSHCRTWVIPTSRLSVERHSRFTMLVKVNGKDTKTVVTALSIQVRTLPQLLRQSLTWDRGMELADHKTFTLATHTWVYFCDPQSPWQRGTNENTKRPLRRRYFPRGTDLSAHSQTELNRIAQKLNQRPQKGIGI